MFYKMINAARDNWYNSGTNSATNIIDYIIKTGHLRDAQIEAIKTYLYLKIACNNEPLAKLFQKGKFNTFNLDEAELSNTMKTHLKENPACAALFEYSLIKNEKGEQISKELEKQIKSFPNSIDYNEFFDKVFYGVSYTDYLFSLPMGAGKTYLMAAFIYLDLYFAMNEPDNKSFAHNFIVFAPSGLKSSVIPSLKTIQKFNPIWVLPEPSASDVKRKMIFEVLDLSKTQAKSNKTKNPNVQKIANHQPLHELFGLVAVTNAEKVILDRIQETNGQIDLVEKSDDEKDKAANELRNLISKIPSLSIFIDEVHHAVNEEIKLRAVVNKWSQNETINSVIGFSGTPYLEKAEKLKVTESLSVSSIEISNIVYYYPLINGILNFLKKPIVKISDAIASSSIIEYGVREFLDHYKDLTYENGLTAKLGIYCGTIEKLEQMVYPLVSVIAVNDYGLPEESILKFHRGNKQYPIPKDNQMEFDNLDKPVSKIRIVLLVQIGKEGWDCRSLTGIILSQEGDCPTNMVLQTSCRCLRQVVKNKTETALIFLNDGNAEKLNTQLVKQQHISLKEFSSVTKSDQTEIKRYDRRVHLELPSLDFYQLKISYDTIIAEKANPQNSISNSAVNADNNVIITTKNINMETIKKEVVDKETGNAPAVFSHWMYGIYKSGFCTISMEQLQEYESLLKDVFNTISYEENGERYFSSKYNIPLIEANIRKGFSDNRKFKTKEELIPEEAKLLNIKNFTPVVYTDMPKNYYPDQLTVKNIILDDNGEFKIPDKEAELIKMAEETGNFDIVQSMHKKHYLDPARNRSYHYIPYKTDSGFEELFLKELLVLDDIEELGLEIYYNGDRDLTDFKIRCYKNHNGKWNYIGMYTPDFLIIKRKNNEIHKAVIVETKGEGFAANFNDKRDFMEKYFKVQNNKEYGYNRFDFLYLEDSMTEKDRIVKTHNAIKIFFNEEYHNAG